MVQFVLPRVFSQEHTGPHVQLISLDLPDAASRAASDLKNGMVRVGPYSQGIMREVDADRTAVTTMLSECTSFDIIHAHDWLTYEAGIVAK